MHEFELLWLALRPRLLPRPLTLILLCIVYCPPWYNCELRHSLCQYIVSSIDELNRKFPNAGIILAGDFNSLETNLFNKHFHFKQIVTKNTRGTNILDKIFTNLDHYYAEPIILPPLGKSDHNCVFLQPIGVHSSAPGYKIIVKRLFTEATVDAIASELGCKTNWSAFYSVDELSS